MATIKKTAGNTAPKRKAYVPETATVDHGHEYPRIPRCPPFLLAYNPVRWTVLEGQVVPQLHHVPLQDGVNGVTRDRNGAWRLAKLKDKLEQQGRTLIPWESGPDGSYVAVVETRLDSGQVVDTHVGAFTETFAGSSDLRADLPGYVAWLQQLMKDGVIPSPAPYVIERLLNEYKQEQRTASVEAKRHETAANLQRLESLERDIKALEKLVQTAPRTPVAKRAAAPTVAE